MSSHFLSLWVAFQDANYKDMHWHGYLYNVVTEFINLLMCRTQLLRTEQNYDKTMIK